MNQEIIKRAEALINAKAGFKDEFGMEGYAALSLIDANGYPSATTFAIAQADGINWLTFGTSLGRGYDERIGKNNKACVCINSDAYTINLVGTVEARTDIETKKATWIPNSAMDNHWSGPDDPNMLVLRFTTERYTIFFADDGSYAADTLKSPEPKTAPVIEPMLQFDRQCEEAIELYKKAFGANVIVFMRFSDADPKDWSSDSPDDQNLIYHAQLMIGNQRILLCDNLFNELPRGHSVYPVITFQTANEVQAAYDVLLDGATVITPIGETTYCACVATLVDKFGIHWDLMAAWS